MTFNFGEHKIDQPMECHQLYNYIWLIKCRLASSVQGSAIVIMRTS